MKYVSIHNHTTYSTLDGLVKIDELVNRAAEFGMPALAITDHRNTSAHVKFYKDCKKAGIKPILGVEANETEDRTIHSRRERIDKGYDDYHLVLLAKDNDGLKNLYKIVSDASTIGYFDKTEQTDLSVLSGLSKGIIASSACLAGRIPKLILQGDIKKAKEWAGIFNELFDEFYLEVQPNSTEDQAKVNNALLEISKSLNIPLVLGIDTHYLDSSDADVHEILLCIQTGKTLADEKRMRFSGGPEYYLWSPEEVKRWVTSSGLPIDVIKNTLHIAEACNVELNLGGYKLPVYTPEDGSTPEEYLRRVCIEELEKRYPGKENYRHRLETELSVIISKGFASYFLILRDIMNFCDRQGIPRGGGRGSAAGCLIAYLLDITKIDPIANGLYFERFLNPYRQSLPDIDVDIGHEDRDKVIEYVRQVYGNVAQIATYSLSHLKGAVRDICRVLGVPYKDADIIAKIVPDKMPDQSDISLEKFFLPLNNMEEAISRWGQTDAEKIQKSAEAFKKAVEQYPLLLSAIKSIEGSVRAVGIHAGGILITPTELTDYCSVLASPGKIVCSLDMDDIDDFGLLKVDLLGLKTVTILHETATRVGVDLNNIPFDDEKVYKLYQEGNTHGVFQVAGGGITQYVKQVKPTRFSDLVDILALYRPGPLDAMTESGRTITDQYIYNREHPKSITVPHPDLEQIYKDSWGVMIYQEQVMAVCQKIAGYSLGGADEFRRVIGKKKVDEVEQLRQEFIYGSDNVPGGLKLGYDEDFLNMIFDQIKAFSGYAFNKSHSCAYAYLSYQTAYLKTYYPVEFMCSLLTSEQHSIDKTMANITECRRMGIKVLPVDVNHSSSGFIIETLPDGTKAIRYGFAGIKDIGEKVASEIIKHQPYKSLEDLVTRVEGRTIHKGVMRTLIMAGVFDTFNPNRYAVLYEYLFDIRKFKPEKEECPLPDDWSEERRYELDREYYGFTISGHPADDLPNKHWAQQPTDSLFYISGMVVKVNTFKDKRGREMATVVLDTPFGECKVYVFANLWEKHSHLLSSAAGNWKLVTFLVKKKRFIKRDLIETVKVYTAEEAVAEQQRRLVERLTAPVKRYSVIRFYG